MIIKNKTVIEEFIRLAKKFSNKTAIKTEHEQSSYSKILSQLEIISNNLSYYCKKEKTLAIAMDRTILQIISILGCLKSDKSFIIFDEKIPLEKKE